MAITSAICNSFKKEILQGGHNLNTTGGSPAGNTFKISLYSKFSSLDFSNCWFVFPVGSVPLSRR